MRTFSTRETALPPSPKGDGLRAGDLSMKAEGIVEACRAWDEHIVSLYSDKAAIGAYSIHEMFKSILRGERPEGDKP